MKKMISRRNFLKAAGVSAAALGLAACGGSSSSTAASTATSTAASSTAAASGASGKVYYLNFKPEQDQALAGSGQGCTPRRLACLSPSSPPLPASTRPP